MTKECLEVTLTNPKDNRIYTIFVEDMEHDGKEGFVLLRGLLYPKVSDLALPLPKPFGPAANLFLRTGLVHLAIPTTIEVEEATNDQVVS